MVIGLVLHGPRARASDGSPSPWAAGAARPFASGSATVGVLSARAEVMLGYGRPFWMATGFVAQATTTAEFFSGLVALRTVLPFVETTFGMREVASYWRAIFPTRAAYSRTDVRNAPGDSSKVLYAHLEIAANLPLGRSVVFANLMWTKPLDLARDHAVFDESHRIVLDRRGTVLIRTGALWGFPVGFADVRVGPWAEVFVLPRSGSPVVRIGPVATIRWTPHLDSLVGFNTPIAGPDDLGLVLGSFAFLNVRYRVATGERHPGFP
jgi:hypothetical protein